MRKSLIIIILIILIASALYFNDVISLAKKIRVEIERMEITEVSFEKVTINVTLCMENPSNNRYSAEDIGYEIYAEREWVTGA